MALCEAAACDAIAGELPSGSTSVGTWIEVEHLAATPVGRVVVGEAHLVAVDGRRLEFEISTSEGATAVARGRHRPMVVDRAGFLAGLTGPQKPDKLFGKLCSCWSNSEITFASL